VLDEARASHYTIWAVAFILYLSDAARLIRWRELLLVESGRGRLRPSLSDHPFTIAGRVLALPPIVRPDRGVFVAAWGGKWAADRDVTAAMTAIGQLRGALTPVRVAAVAGFALLFVVGPALTFFGGPGLAVLGTAALLYPTILGTALLLWRKRHALRLTPTQTIGLGLELLVCPAFLPNLVRKITTKHRVDADGAQIAAVTASGEARDEFFARLQGRADELLNEADGDDALQQELRSYLVMLRGAR
jgi:hypothetical protein